MLGAKSQSASDSDCKTMTGSLVNSKVPFTAAVSIGTLPRGKGDHLRRCDVVMRSNREDSSRMQAFEVHSFETPRQLEKWLASNHETEQELWVRIFHKKSGTPTVTWDDCVVAAIAWGWIDCQRRSFDKASFLQRLTPRRSRSNWSKRNTEHAERLIAEGRLQPSGLAHVEAARKDGRWEKAYSGSAEMVMPDDFVKELQKIPAAKQFFEMLDRKNLYMIYHRLQTANHTETRKKRVEIILAHLARGQAFN